MNLTPWFPREVLPVNVGVYEIRSHWNRACIGTYSYWTGQMWGWPCRDANTAKREALYCGMPYIKRLEWRGLKETAA